MRCRCWWSYHVLYCSGAAWWTKLHDAGQFLCSQRILGCGFIILSCCHGWITSGLQCWRYPHHVITGRKTGFSVISKGFDGSASGANVCCIMGYIMADTVIMGCFPENISWIFGNLALRFVKMMIATESVIFIQWQFHLILMQAPSN